MFAHLKSSKTINSCLLAPVSILLLAPSSGAQTEVNGTLIAQSKYVQTYSFGKKTSQSKPKPKATTTTKTPAASSKKSTGAKQSSAKAATTAKKKKIDMIVGPKQYTSSGGAKWEKFSDFIKLKPGQEKLPLKFTILNGSGGTPPLRAIRATLSGRVLFTEKDFKGKRKLSINLANALSPGATQIIFTSYGAAGSAFKWQISSSASPQILSLSPAKANKDKLVTVKGKNLPAEKSAIRVIVDKKSAQITDPQPTGFKFRIPKKVKPGKNKVVTIYVSGKKMKSYKIAIQATPEILYLSHIAIAGKQTIVITGKNFSDDAKDIEVTFNGAKGYVSNCSEKSISVLTPDWRAVPSPQTIQVKVSGIACKKPGKVLGNMRNIPNDGRFSPYSIAGHLL